MGRCIEVSKQSIFLGKKETTSSIICLMSVKIVQMDQKEISFVVENLQTILKHKVIYFRERWYFKLN